MAENVGNYMVYVHEQLRDGVQSWARCFNNLDKAIDYINNSHFGKDSLTFRLFELGAEITLIEEVREDPQPPRKTTRFRVQGV